MASMLSQQERRLLTAARNAGNGDSGIAIDFEWRQAAQSAKIRPDEAVAILRGLRRFGYIDGISSSHARLTVDGIRAADDLD